MGQNPTPYIPAIINTKHFDGWGTSVPIDETAALIGFHARMEASEEQRSVATGKLNPTETAIKHIRVDTLLTFADRIDPDHHDDSLAIRSQLTGGAR